MDKLASPRGDQWPCLAYTTGGPQIHTSIAFARKEERKKEKKPQAAAMGLQTLLLCFLALAASAHGQSQMSGFISIDCGLADNAPYRDSSTQLVYSPDAPYVNTGVNKKVSSEYNLGNIPRRYADLRSFPNGTRNCYTLAPVQRGAKYLLTAGFLYGNYDGLNQPPEFDLHLGVNLWQTVEANSVLVEIIAVAPASSIQVCLVNKGMGTPFISALELRPLLDSMYTLVNGSQALVLHQRRYNYGGKADVQIRYPDDPYDRLWYTPDQYATGWTPVSNDSAEVTAELSREFLVPSAVMKTAVTAASLSLSLNFTIAGNVGDKIYLFMHFAELRLLGANESRVFNVYANGLLWYGPYSPPYLQAGGLRTSRPRPGETNIYTLTATSYSTLPPIINALEVYTLRQLSLLPTDDGDVNAILNIKGLYQAERDWEGDPCSPKELTWDGLSCSYGDLESPRIISLNLSFNSLAGGIPTSIANFTALKILDLSHNNFTGEIPSYLAELAALSSLNLASNQLTGLVPQILTDKSQNGSLLLSIADNPGLCYNVGSCNTVKKNKRKILVPIIIAGSAFAVLLLVILILIWIVKRGRKQDAFQSKSQELTINMPRLDNNPQIQKQVDGLQTENHQFKFSEIASMTNNFQRAIGRGGFGIVYHGYLPDKAQVAVKILSQSSSQGAKEFQTEAIVLTRVHHKNLVSLLGYCNEKNNLALVYEFMPQGSLAMHLSGNSDINGLSWRVRLTIALHSAQGLDYLHNGYKPPIVHRDVKTANILLDENFGAKLADFGLSRMFSSEEATHISTAVAGTLGYLDPEYQRTYKLNEKSDVYSFGVVLMALITGRAPISSGPEEIHITQWVLSRIERGDINSIIDHRLQGDYDANSAWKAVDIAMACASSASIQRPTMSEVVMQLKECLASEAGGDYSYNFRTQDTDSMFNPSTR